MPLRRFRVVFQGECHCRTHYSLFEYFAWQAGIRYSKIDGFVKSPSAALRFIFRHSDVRLSTPHSSILRLTAWEEARALHLELFTVPSVY